MYPNASAQLPAKTRPRKVLRGSHVADSRIPSRPDLPMKPASARALAAVTETTMAIGNPGGRHDWYHAEIGDAAVDMRYTGVDNVDRQTAAPEKRTHPNALPVPWGVVPAADVARRVTRIIRADPGVSASVRPALVADLGTLHFRPAVEAPQALTVLELSSRSQVGNSTCSNPKTGRPLLTTTC